MDTFLLTLVRDNLSFSSRLMNDSDSCCDLESVGSISTAEGSALVRMGATTVVCGVKAEVAEPELDKDNEGFLVPNLDLPAMCSPKFKPGPPSEEAQVLSDRLNQALVALVIHPGKAVWVIYVDATCINYDGNAFDATLLAMVAALKNTTLPQAIYNEETQKTLCSRTAPRVPLQLSSSIPLSASFGIFDSKYVLADPTSFEEPLLESSLSVIAGDDGEIVAVSQVGSALIRAEVDGHEVQKDVLEDCIQLAKQRRDEVARQIFKPSQVLLNPEKAQRHSHHKHSKYDKRARSASIDLRHVEIRAGVLASVIVMSETMDGRWVGPMPIQPFMDSFFGPTNLSHQKPDGSAKNWKAHFKSLETLSDANEMCGHIQRLISTSGATPGMKVLRVAPQAKEVGYVQKRTTLALLSDEDPLLLESMQLCITTKLSKQELQEEKRSKDDKHKEYCDVLFGLENGRKGCARCRDELVSQAKVLLYQHRTHAFVIQMVDPYARLIRFDRDGAIVSARFHYREEGDLLLEFLWRYSNASEETRGRDPTVFRATVAEAALAKEKLAGWVRKVSGIWSVYKLVIQDRDSSRTDERRKMEVLVWVPASWPLSVTGRATKGYIGYDPESDRVVFVKDSWRSTDPTMQKETDTLRAINSAGITEGVPVLLCGDDLEGRWQSTVTADYSQENWNVGGDCEESHRVHIRFVTDKVGKPVEKFKTSKDFLKAVYDAYRAHKAVYEKCQILHCDVSVGNILVTADGKGFLNDWDQARNVEYLVSGPHRAFRTGTWRFMSTNLLLRPQKVHGLQDDIESFFWVTAYTILCFLKHNWTSHVTLIMEAVYDECRNNTRLDAVTGGTGKLGHLTCFSPLATPLEVPRNKPLTDFFDHACCLIVSQQFTETNVRKKVKFKTTPRDMERDISLALKDVADSALVPLSTHAALEAVFVEALAAEGWPENDRAHNYFKSAVRKSAEKKKANAMRDAVPALQG
ncbi:hypothetical protein D9613_004763 [Agrocybe pediades]|uniref:Ribosomal RNA-processing protein 43 n=1 Tax=Agrocybe pediades TaxID=84607 RepID=A0A8H4QY24_9AGAR|nr:hypothetical protein D9613_004763 [Agrocybe pediades]